MFRIVTEFVGETHFLAICAHIHCGQYLSVKASEMGEGLPQQQATFVAQMQVNGWAVGLDAIYCALHVAKAREAQNYVQVARPTIAFN